VRGPQNCIAKLRQTDGKYLIFLIVNPGLGIHLPPSKGLLHIIQV